MSKLETMRIFVEVADSGGFAVAARRLNLSAPAVTRAVAALERALGVALFIRSTRVVRLSEVGARYLADCRRILADVDEADAAVNGSTTRPTGVLTLTASVLFGQLYLIPVIQEYLDLYPEVAVNAIFVDRVTHIIDEGIDVAVRIGHLPDSSLHAVQIGTTRRVVCAAPSYLQRSGTPQTPAELAHHNIIASSSAWTSFEWFFGADERTRVQVSPRLVFSSLEAVIRATRDGWGLSRPLSYQIADDVAKGTLTTVLDAVAPDPLPINIVYPQGRRAPAKVRAFVELATARLRTLGAVS